MKFTLIIRPDGHALLTTIEKVEGPAFVAIREHVAPWDQGDIGVAVIPECGVIQVSEIAIDLGEPLPAEGA